jgi:hypothetical protein
MLVGVSAVKSMSMGTMATAGREDSMMFSGNLTGVAGDGSETVSLANLAGLSDAAMVYLLAHEFAHVVLRHPQMGRVVAVTIAQDQLEPIAMAELKDCCDDAADLLVLTWGFEAERTCFHDEEPDAFRPRWDFEWNDPDTYAAQLTALYGITQPPKEEH